MRAHIFLGLVSNEQIECGLVLFVLLSTTKCVIRVVKMFWTYEAQPSESTTNLTRTLCVTISCLFVCFLMFLSCFFLAWCFPP